MNQIELIRKVLTYLNLDSDRDDFDRIHEVIEKDLLFKGTNLWILVFAIIVASVGLNMNSTAVVIGAMLISPLMGPINGIGYGLATYNFPLFRRAIKNFTFAILASLLASTVYFTISPIATAHSELLARTSPTIYDVLIALFGGLAGIVAISSKQKGNVIPGVAIATALMPPLCTAGYGLATAQFTYFLGALYLFTINSAFMAISSVIISQILKFPVRNLISDSQKRRVHRIITVTILLILIPSIYFGYRLVQKEKFILNAGKYVNNISVYEGNYLLKNEIDASHNTIKLVYGGMNLNDVQKEAIREKARDFSLGNVRIIFTQGLSFEEITQKENEVEKLKAEMNSLNALVKSKDRIIDSLETRNLRGKQILEEIKAVFPQIKGCTYADSYDFSEEGRNAEKVEIVIFNLTEKKLSGDEKKKIEQWLTVRLKAKQIHVYYD